MINKEISQAEQIFRWRRERYRHKARKIHPYQEAQATCLRVNRLIHRNCLDLVFPDDFIPDGQTQAAAQAVFPADLLATECTYDPISQSLRLSGTAGSVVALRDTCMVELAQYFASWGASASCGECTFCRLGTRQIHEKLQLIQTGRGQTDFADELLDLASQLLAATRCEVGKIVAKPVLASVLHFRWQYEEHITQGVCCSKRCQLQEYQTM